VQNVFDREPPAISAGSAGTAFRIGRSAIGNWDLLGRRAFASVSRSF
jgi:hypothetical protein